MQQILCTAAMHATLLYSESVALKCHYTKGLFAWETKMGLSLVYLKKELFKFSLTASIMA